MTLPTESTIQDELENYLRSDGGWVPTHQAYKGIADALGLLSSQLNETMLDGRNHFENRVQFARRKLVDAGKIDSSRRGYWKII